MVLYPKIYPLHFDFIWLIFHHHMHTYHWFYGYGIKALLLSSVRIHKTFISSVNTLRVFSRIFNQWEVKSSSCRVPMCSIMLWIIEKIKRFGQFEIVWARNQYFAVWVQKFITTDQKSTLEWFFRCKNHLEFSTVHMFRSRANSLRRISEYANTLKIQWK